MDIAYIGLDHHRAPYLESIAQLDATVTSACEPAASTTPSDVPNLADDTAFYTDPVDLLDGENVALLWLTLSNADTPPIVSGALERDIDLFTEKPIARTESDLDPLLATERASEAGVAVSYLCEGRYDTKIDVYGADDCSPWDPIGED